MELKPPVSFALEHELRVEGHSRASGLPKVGSFSVPDRILTASPSHTEAPENSASVLPAMDTAAIAAAAAAAGSAQWAGSGVRKGLGGGMGATLRADRSNK